LPYKATGFVPKATVDASLTFDHVVMKKVVSSCNMQQENLLQRFWHNISIGLQTFSQLVHDQNTSRQD